MALPCPDIMSMLEIRLEWKIPHSPSDLVVSEQKAELQQRLHSLSGSGDGSSVTSLKAAKEWEVSNEANFFPKIVTFKSVGDVHGSLK